MEPDPFIGRTIGSFRALPARLAPCLALALFLATGLALAGCPRKAAPPLEAGPNSLPVAKAEAKPALPPGLVH